MAFWLAPYQSHQPSAPALGFVTSTLFSLLAGLLHALAIAWPFEGLMVAPGQASGALQLLSLLFLAALVLQESSLRRIFICTWIFATAMLAGTFWWLVISMHQYGGMALPLAIAAMLLLSMALGLYYPLAMLLWRMLCPMRQKPMLQVLGFALAWLAAELLRGQLFTGFPWGASGYAHIDSLLSPLAPLVGVYGISFVAALLAALWIHVTSRWRVLSIVATAALYAGLPPSHDLWQREDSRRMGEIKIALLQTNIAQNQKFDPAMRQKQLTWLSDQLINTKAQLLVAPETAITVLPDQLPQGYLSQLHNTLAQQGKTALIGLPISTQLANGLTAYANAAVAIGAGQNQKTADAYAYVYKKQHLVPFGEFIPPGFRWFVRMMSIPLGDFDRGDTPPTALVVHGQRVMPHICYEDLFGEELAQTWPDAAQTPKTANLTPSVLVNMSNIAWFGNTVAIPQHLNISRMRALELSRPMVRATNTGATAVIDHKGRVQAQLAPHTQGVLTHTVQAQSGDTPYQQWVSRFGLWPWWALIALGLMWMTWARWRSPRVTNTESIQMTESSELSSRRHRRPFKSQGDDLARQGRQDRQRH